MHRHVRADDVGEHEGVAGVGFLAAHAVAVAIAGGRHRVEREDLPGAGAECGDQQAAAGLDRHRNRHLGAVAVISQQVQQDLIALQVVADAALGQQLARGPSMIAT
ncbi:hypothetical protein GCM10010343_14620 [Streptomyces avidinii]|nr:hypothetical protein GCM10010343_14620 [Streptomyces avidinii]